MVLVLDGNSNQMRMHEGKLGFRIKQNPLHDCYLPNQKPLKSVQITDIAPYVRTYF